MPTPPPNRRRRSGQPTSGQPESVEPAASDPAPAEEAPPEGIAGDGATVVTGGASPRDSVEVEIDNLDA
jgi:hypothetical protein